MRGSPVPDRSAAVTVIISIHASTWEAATIQIQILKEHVLFQFTPLHERQQHSPQQIDALSHFNSRLYMRGSRCCLDLFSVFSDFNSRLYMRGSLCSSVFSTSALLFQFTPLHERQLQKYTIFSIKSTQFSTKPCFFIVTSRKVVFFSIPVQYFL